MIEYVLIYVENDKNKFLLLNKNRPAWQRNRLNLPGGRIEDGEDACLASARELKEETGLEVESAYILPLGKIVDEDVVVHCVYVNKLLSSELNTEEDQLPEWFSWDDVKNSNRLIPNLKVIIPLLKSKTQDWEVYDNYRDGVDFHEIIVKIPDLRTFK